MNPVSLAGFFFIVKFQIDNFIMVVERQDNEIVIRLPESVIGMDEVQRLLDYFRFLESNAKNQGTLEQAAKLAEEVDSNWWLENKHRFIS